LTEIFGSKSSLDRELEMTSIYAVGGIVHLPLLSTLLVYGAVGMLHFLLRRQFFALSFEGKGGLFLEFSQGFFSGKGSIITTDPD
jgi:hypothetical protein